MAPGTQARQVSVPNSRGLHARPCHAIAAAALGFQSELRVGCDGQEVNGKSILELMTLGAAQGAVLTFSARGEDAEQLLDTLERLVRSGFGESP